jgi:hypothetical protein
MGAAQEIIARELMKKLKVPEPVANAVVSLRGGAVSIPPVGLRDTLLLARYLSPVQCPLPRREDSYLTQTAALARYLDEHPEILACLDDASEDAKSMSTALLV